MADSGLDAEIDRLYGLPLGDFTKERDALARRLRSEGRRDDAAEVAALRKPVLAAWVVNRLARERRERVGGLVAAAAAIRAGEPDAGERFRRAVDDLLRDARELLSADGRPATDAVLRDVATTIRSAAAADPEQLTGGRLTEPIEATGFEAMAGAAPPRTQVRPAAERPKKDAAADRARVEQARKALAAARKDAGRLAREADAAEREARQKRAEADAAERRVAEAEERVARARR